MTKIVMNLPFPPSVNSIWRGGRRRVFRSQVYIDWTNVAGKCWLAQKTTQPKNISGSFSAVLILSPPDKRHRDLDNYLKGVLDLCKLHRVIDDDHLCRRIYLRWGTPKEAPMGARLVLKDA